MLEEAVAAYAEELQASKRLVLTDLFAAVEPAFAADGFRDEGPVRSILLVRLDVIGDLVMTSSLIRELRRNYPQARFDVVTSPLVKPMLEVCPYIDKVYTFDRFCFLGPGNLVPGFLKMLDLCRGSLWLQHYDLAICPEWSGNKADVMLLLYLSGARRRLAFDQVIWVKVYMPGVIILPQDEDFQRSLRIEACLTPPDLVHEALRPLHFLTLLGLKAESNALEVWLCERDRARARRWLFPYRDAFLVTLGIGAGSMERRYPVEGYRVAMERIIERYPATRFVVVGGKAEQEEGQYLAKNLPAGRVIDLSCRTTIRESAAVVAETALYLGNDTGLMHIAAALKRPVILVCREAQEWQPCYPGVTSALARYYPWQTMNLVLRPLRPLGDCATLDSYGGCEAGKPHCIAQIPPEAIVRAFDEMMTMLQNPTNTGQA